MKKLIFSNFLEKISIKFSPHRPFFRQFFLFSIMGALGTLVQYLILYLFVEHFHRSPVWGSSIGFVAGAIVNYYCNYYITFNSRHSHYSAGSKFFIVASIGLFLNGLMMHVGIYFGMKYFYAQVMATFLVLFWNFFVNRHWTFTSKDKK